MVIKPFPDQEKKSERRTDRSMAGVELYVVLSNQSGRQNLGTYLRTASAFGATQVIVVGSQRFGTHGAHRAQKYVDIVHFYELRDAREYLKSKGCAIFGVSTMHAAGASAAHATEYTGSSAFMIDNEFAGLSDEQRAACDHLVHVPSHGEQTAASLSLALDTTVVMAIALRHFARFARFAERSIESTSTQGKFVLDAYPTPDRVQAGAQSEQVAAEREAKRVAAAASDALDGDDLAGMFD